MGLVQIVRKGDQTERERANARMGRAMMCSAGQSPGQIILVRFWICNLQLLDSGSPPRCIAGMAAVESLSPQTQKEFRARLVGSYLAAQVTAGVIAPPPPKSTPYLL